MPPALYIFCPNNCSEERRPTEASNAAENFGPDRGSIVSLVRMRTGGGFVNGGGGPRRLVQRRRCHVWHDEPFAFLSALRHRARYCTVPYEDACMTGFQYDSYPYCTNTHAYLGSSTACFEPGCECRVSGVGHAPTGLSVDATGRHSSGPSSPAR